MLTNALVTTPLFVPARPLRVTEDFSSEIFSTATGKFACGRCGNEFAHKHNLRKHLRYTCMREPQLPCPYCPRRFKQKADMQRHIGLKHRQYLYPL